MADEEKRKLDIPWATLLPILAALAGIVAQYKPLVSVRPAVASQRTVGVLADQDVNARLWQDPLSTAEQEREALDAAGPAKKSAVDRLARHSTGALAERIKKTVCERGNEHVLILSIMLDSGPYLEQTESRLRDRRAVLEGLSESGYVPVDGEHIGFVVQNPWPLVPPHPCPPSPLSPPALVDSLLIPWEECRKAAGSDSTAAQEPAKIGFDSVFVLWLPATNFNPNPLGNFAALLMELAGRNEKDRAGFAVKLIGPANSTGLQAMLRETAAWSTDKRPLRDQALDGVEIYCALATASDKELLQQAGLWKEGEPEPELALEDRIERSVANGLRRGLQFERTILPDDKLLQALIEELLLRGVHAGPWQDEKEDGHNGDHIAILTEWDTTYGRGLAKTFEDEAMPEPPIKCDHENDCAHQIGFFRYMHGIDGRLPGDVPKEAKSDDSQKSSTLNAQGEATEGLNQADYLRRLARRLKEEETRQWLAGGNPLRAIGILGSDIYDKLMILRALRPEFPDAIFFTNNYDARFELRGEWDETHNLVIASPFTGSFLVDQKSRVAPFRDSNQTSMYATTLLAMGKIDETEIEPTIFEVGRKGAEELVRTVDTAPAQVTTSGLPGHGAFIRWLAGPRVRLSAALISVSLVLMAGWIVLGTVDRRELGGGGRLHRLKRGSVNTYAWLLVGVPLVVSLIVWIANLGDGNLEPLLFLSGISIWPTEMLRLVALILAIHFMIKAGVELRANQEKLTPRYHLTKLPDERPISLQIKLGLRRWQKQHGEWMQSDAQFTAKDAWTAYLWRNTWAPRFVRVGLLSLIYFAFAYGVWKLFPAPLLPTRGHTAALADKFVLYTSVAGLILLMFYVVDSIRLNSNFIRLVTGGVTQWEPQLSIGGRIPPLTTDELARYHDIKFIEERTEVVTPLIWYPLIALAVMIFARSAYFDNWAWPPSLILIFALNALWAFAAAAYLRRAAEHLRTEAIRKLQACRIASYKSSERRQMFDELIDEIRALKKGAFAPLSEQPFIRAVILPSGGLGLLAVGQRLLDIF